MTTTCKLCQFTYCSEYPEDQRAHKNLHARISRTIRSVENPQPIKRFITWQERSATQETAAWVTWISPIWLQNEIYKRAWVFKREFGYDFTQWAQYGERDPYAHGFVFQDPDHPGVMLGACAFRWRGDHWAMQWIWICPSARRSGLLTKWWPVFQQKFGDFAVERPLSDAMKAFVEKMKAKVD